MPLSRGYPGRAVDAARSGMDAVDLLCEGQVLALVGSPGGGLGEPLVVAGPVELQDLAQPLHVVGVPMVVGRPGSDSPVRLSGEILSGLAQDVPLGGQLPLAGFKLAHPGLQLPDPTVWLVGLAGPDVAAVAAHMDCHGRSDTAAFAVSQHPFSQRRLVDAQVSSDGALSFASGMDSFRATASALNSSA